MSARARSMTSRSSPATRSSWTSSPTSSPTASCSCPRGSRRERSGRWSSASTGWRAGRATSPTRRSTTRPITEFAVRLAEQGFITFAPQNLYIFGDRFRTLQRKANPLKKTLFSIIVPQHQQITDWLKTLPFVDPARIAFYGLSYGGKSAMRIPPLVKNYCLSICSADFNEWVWKNASTPEPYSYVWTHEYEIFEFDLGSTFNYAEMAALIAPRPFMVERGHFDGVAPDEDRRL